VANFGLLLQAPHIMGLFSGRKRDISLISCLLSCQETLPVRIKNPVCSQFDLVIE
jgi:hypothetical protein